MQSSDDNSWNTAVLAAKEVGIGRYTQNGVTIPITGVQAAAQAGTSADSIGLTIVKQLIGQFTNSLVSWINNGFQGGPLFVTDPGQFFIGVGDRIAGHFIEGSELGFLCYPFALDIRLALNLNYSAAFEDEIRCTLTDVIGNIEGFTEDFNQGGWGAWFSMTQNSQNNVYGAYLDASSELEIRLASALGIEGMKLDWGKGFLSFQDCEVPDPAGGCLEYGPVQTPGTVIEGQLEESLGTNLRQLELADEFDEIIGALVNQLLYQAITQGGGLLGS